MGNNVVQKNRPRHRPLVPDRAALDSAADKIVWHVRHGESEGNAAKHAAMAADELSGTPL